MIVTNIVHKNTILWALKNQLAKLQNEADPQVLPPAYIRAMGEEIDRLKALIRDLKEEMGDK